MMMTTSLQNSDGWRPNPSGSRIHALVLRTSPPLRSRRKISTAIERM